METFHPPRPLNMDEDVGLSWPRWLRRFRQFLAANEADKKSDETKIGMLLSAIGEEAEERFEQFQWASGEDKNKFEVVVTKFDTEFAGEKRVVFNRYLFWSQYRPEGQKFQEYLTQLRILAARCEFKETDNMIRDKIIFCVSEQALKQKLLQQKNPSLDKVISICQAAEVTRNEAEAMIKSAKETSQHQVNVLRSEQQATDQQVQTLRRQQQHNQASRGSRKPYFYGRLRWKQNDTAEFCSRCGNPDHDENNENCPAWGKLCNECYRRHHFASQCRSKKKTRRRIHNLEQPTDDDNYEMGSLSYLHINTAIEEKRAWYTSVKVADSYITMKIDSGAETNTIPYKTWKRIKKRPVLTSSSVMLKALGGTVIEHKGTALVEMKVGEKQCKAEIYVTSQKTVPILGLQTCLKLGLIQPGENVDEIHAVSRDQLTEESLQNSYPEVFNGLGKYEGKYKIRLREDAEPIIQPPRRVPPKLLPALRQKLQEMEQRGVIEKVDQPTDWVSNLVITEKKDGSIRLCLDPRQLNKSIKREHFPTPTMEDIIVQLGGKKIFTILDQKDAFWQIELDDESAPLCTFNSPFGRYMFKRMPFGISSASEIQQKKTFQTFGDIPGVHIVADDMLIAAKDDDEHDEILHKVLSRAQQQGVRFNLKKLQLRRNEVMYLGMKVSGEGITPDPAKIEAIINMPDPSDRTGVLRLLGMLNFLSSFIPNKAKITAPLRNLLKSDVPWHWEAEHKQAMSDIKQVLTSTPALKLFDSSAPATIQSDASAHGIGACLLQNGHPVAYVSRSLSDTESRYAVLEKELLAILFAATKFQHYIYGTSVTVQCDHKPLEQIFKKPLHSASPRVQLMLMKLLKYKLEVGYVPGSKMYIADTLSRAYLPRSGNQLESVIKESEYRVHSVVENLPASEQRILEFKEASADDQHICKLIKYTENGWPHHKSSVHPALQPYWDFRDELHCEGVLLFRGERLVIPRSMQPTMLQPLNYK